jgi:hypothetical protein
MKATGVGIVGWLILCAAAHCDKFVITGVVADEAARPVAEAEVFSWAVNARDCQPVTTRSSPNGSFRLQFDATGPQAWAVQTLALKYAFPEMDADEVRDAEAQVRDQLSALYVVEILVEDPTGAFNLRDFHQPNPDVDAADLQVPYDEVALDTGESDGSGTTRIAFFLHFVDPNAGVETPFGHVPLPAATPLPARLAEVMKYEPVD